MDYPDDPGLATVLRSLRVEPGALLGHGGEAWVYALDADRVVRVLHEGPDASVIERRVALVSELASRGAAFALPEVEVVAEVAGRWYSVERRLPGRPVSELLTILEGAERDRLVENHLTAASSLGELHLAPRTWVGELTADDAIRTETWPEYLEARVARSLANAPREFHAVSPGALAEALPPAATLGFVHLDAFTGNMLAVGSTITAILDFGVTSVLGDPQLDPLSCAVYLSAPQITPAATSRDRDVATSWLRAAGLAPWFEPMQRWLAGFWSWAADDAALHAWCRGVLLDVQ